jgi:hypothetical protein
MLSSTDDALSLPTTTYQVLIKLEFHHDPSKPDRRIPEMSVTLPSLSIQRLEEPTK